MRHAIAVVLALAAASCAEPAPERSSPATTPNKIPVTLSFTKAGKSPHVVASTDLQAAAPPETWTAFDPYYQKPKTFRAMPLAPVLERGFGVPRTELEKHDFVLRARDGYTVPITGARLFEKGGYIAIADVDVSGWEPIGPGRANPGPFYLVWREPSQMNLDTHPRPWQLASIEMAPFASTFPHVAPTGVAEGSPAMRGFSLFRQTCIACHAINREGGRIGPDLNVPQSIVEYRPEPQIRAYIKDPRTFRYSNMPAHPAFKDADLDALIAYFHAMKDRKHDPEAKTP